MKCTAAMFMACLFALQITGPVYAAATAQTVRRPATPVKYVSDKMANELQLSQEQKSKIEAIESADREKRVAIVQKAKEEIKALYEETNKKVEAVLTPEQLRKYEGMREKNKKIFQKRQARRRK